MACDLVLKTDDIQSLEPLKAGLQNYADVVVAVDGAVLVRSRDRSAHRPSP